MQIIIIVLTFSQKNARMVFSFLTEVSFYFINKIYENLLIFGVTPCDLFFLITPFIVNGLLLYFGYNAEYLFIKKIYLKIIILISSWFLFFTIYYYVNNLPDIVSNITLYLSGLCILIFVVFYNNPQKRLIDHKQIAFNAFSPILEKQEISFSSATSFIIFFQRIKKISKFKIIKGKESITYYPFFLSPDLINEYFLVVYVLEKDIKDDNIKYLTVTSVNDKVKHFNQIIKFLIQHLKKSAKIKDSNIKKLMPFLTKNEDINKTFRIDLYLIFIANNNHLIPLFIKFWEDIELNNISNCELETNKNLNLIELLENSMGIYFIILEQLYLKGDKKTIKKQLYLFFNNYKSFQKLDLKHLKNKESEQILIIFFICILNESDLDIKIFTNAFITILKNT
jgi:hypothetical protein